METLINILIGLGIVAGFWLVQGLLMVIGFYFLIILNMIIEENKY